MFQCSVAKFQIYPLHNFELGKNNIPLTIEEFLRAIYRRLDNYTFLHSPIISWFAWKSDPRTMIFCPVFKVKYIRWRNYPYSPFQPLGLISFDLLHYILYCTFATDTNWVFSITIFISLFDNTHSLSSSQWIRWLKLLLNIQHSVCIYWMYPGLIKFKRRYRLIRDINTTGP